MSLFLSYILCKHYSVQTIKLPTYIILKKVIFYFKFNQSNIINATLILFLNSE